ncbi:MAG: 2-dehydropantoate 2-reductase, partial [Pseudomonadota bacterium]
VRFAIIGAGGIGGQLAVRLARAGEAVGVVARGRHLAAIKAGGLILRTPDEEVSAELPAADHGRDLRPMGPGDVVIFAVKGQDLADAMDVAEPLMANGAYALPMLNGVEATDLLAAHYGADRALIGIARVGAHIEAPGVVAQTTPFARYTVGTADGGQSAPVIVEIRRRFEAAGIATLDHPDLRVDLWQKFAMLTALSGTTAGARCDAATIAASPALMALFRRLALEVVAVGRARGVPLSDGLAEEAVAFVEKAGPGIRSSMSFDLEAGKPLELDWLNGAVARLAAESGIDAPAHATVAALLEPFKAGRP